MLLNCVLKFYIICCTTSFLIKNCFRESGKVIPGNIGHLTFLPEGKFVTAHPCVYMPHRIYSVVVKRKKKLATSKPNNIASVKPICYQARLYRFSSGRPMVSAEHLLLSRVYEMYTKISLASIGFRRFAPNIIRGVGRDTIYCDCVFRGISRIISVHERHGLRGGTFGVSDLRYHAENGNAVTSGEPRTIFKSLCPRRCCFGEISYRTRQTGKRPNRIRRRVVSSAD